MCLTCSHHWTVVFVVDRAVNTVAQRGTLGQENGKRESRSNIICYYLSLFLHFKMKARLDSAKAASLWLIYQPRPQMCQKENHRANCRLETSPRCIKQAPLKEKDNFVLPCVQKEFDSRRLPPSARGTPAPPPPRSRHPSSWWRKSGHFIFKEKKSLKCKDWAVRVPWVGHLMLINSTEFMNISEIWEVQRCGNTDSARMWICSHGQSLLRGPLWAKKTWFTFQFLFIV